MLNEYNYFMQPYNMEGVGNIYPIKLKDYDEFYELANKIIVNDIKNINNLLRIRFQTLQQEGKIDRFEKFKRIPYYHLFDFIIHTNNEFEKKRNEIITYINNIKQELLNNKENNKEEVLSMIKDYNEKIPTSDLNKLLYMLLKKETKIVNNEILIYDKSNICGKITKDNFYQFRDIVMKNNLLYEPLIGYDKESNDLINQALKSKLNNNKKSSRESIMICVSLHKHLSDEELMNYTMYRLMADYNMISREHYNELYFIIKAVADGKMDIPDLGEDLELYKNPYDSIMQQHDGYNDLDKKLRQE